MLSRHPLPLVCLLAALLLTACESAVTQENYDKITTGMTLSQVEAILGSGEEDTAPAGFDISSPGVLSGAGASKDRTFIWKDGPSEIIITFTDNKVVQKRQTGL